MTKTPCPQCDKSMRTQSGLDWHLEHTHGDNGVNEAQRPQPLEADASQQETLVQNTTSESTDQGQGAEDIESTLEEIQRQVDSRFSGEEVPEQILADCYLIFADRQ